MNPIKLDSIMVYPIKSLSGIGVYEWTVAKTGLLYDRKWMLIGADGHFLSQRKIPRMALVKTAINDGNLMLSAPGMDGLSLPMATNSGITVDCTIWGDRCQALNVSNLADEWFSTFLKQKCQLVFQPDDSIRLVDPHYGQSQDQVSFSDGFPFLIISEASLDSLNQAMPTALPMNRFRPNLVVSGCEAYAEDFWREIQIGGIGFRLPKPCSRCLVPTVNQDTGEPGKEPLLTLNRTRKWQNKVYFGQNAVHNDCGKLAVGDAVTILSDGPQQPPLGH